MDASPYYDNENNTQQYIDEKDFVELPPLLPEDQDPKKAAAFNLSQQVQQNGGGTNAQSGG